MDQAEDGEDDFPMSRFSTRERAGWLKSFGAAVREARLKAGMTQEQLGLKSDLDQTYVSGIERGLRNPTVWVIRRIAIALSVGAAEILVRAESIRSGK